MPKEDFEKNAAKEAPKEEKPLEQGPVFGNEENMGKFRELGDDGKNLINKLYEGTRNRLIDRPKIAFDERLYSRHHEKSVKIADKLNLCKKEQGELEAAINRHEELITSYGKESDPRHWGRLVKEKKSLNLFLEKEKNRFDKLQKKLENRNSKKEGYVKKINEVCTKVLKRVETRLVPYEKRIDGLKNKRDNLDSRIETLDRAKSRAENQIRLRREEYENLPKKIGKVRMKAERNKLKKEIKEISKGIKETDKNLRRQIKERAKTEQRFIHVNKKTDYWRFTHNRFSRVTKRERVYLDVGEKIIEKPEVEGRFFTIPEELGKEIKPREFLQTKYVEQEWNKNFGSEIVIKPGSLPGTKISTKRLEEFLMDYFGKQFGEKKTRRDLRHLKKLNKHVRKLRFLLKYGTK